MKKFLLLAIIICFISSGTSAQDKTITLKLYQTTDVHGNFFPFDFMTNRPSKGSFARVSTFMNEQRAKHPNVLLLDGGDLLQGQPSVYYYNFVDTLSSHLCADMMNYMKYDVAVMGNHDIEAGHAVYDRWLKDCRFPVLGANILTKDNKPYIPPYVILEREGVKIAVLGMITEAIPAWLPENLWWGLHFANIEETARQWMPVIQQQEKPDVIVGLFHTGVKSNNVAGFNESVGLEVAERVPGFDVIFCGHDHSVFCQKVANAEGDSVLVINPAARAYNISDVTIDVQLKDGKAVSKQIDGSIRDIATIEPDSEFMSHFAYAFDKTKEYVDAEIGEFTTTISSREAFFGPSAFIDLLHELQLNVSGAEVSLVAPLSQNASIKEGKVYMRDMFNLYRYENLLYTMRLSGEEIKKALEYCYGMWTKRMQSPEDNLLLIQPNTHNDGYQFVYPSYTFDSAAGIIYTVDVTKPTGERVTIMSMADGTPFEPSKIYNVAVNSYQGSGGGGILVQGSGISREELNERIVFSTDKDLRYYLAEQIKRMGTVDPKPLNQWRFIPERWTKPAAERDYNLLFGR